MLIELTDEAKEIIKQLYKLKFIETIGISSDCIIIYINKKLSKKDQEQMPIRIDNHIVKISYIGKIKPAKYN